jgi:serine/threonine protein kinase/formylglycine-generating enzyme required for sulfatase activity
VSERRPSGLTHQPTLANPTSRSAPPPAPLPSRYTDLGVIAAGGSAKVHRVRDERVGQVVVMKLLRGTLFASQDSRARFLREPTITARLAHPAVVSIHDMGELSDGRLWFTMDAVGGQTLTAVVHARPLVPLRRLIDTLAQVARAIASAHSQGITHRDIKPDNIMVGAFREVRVMDWGLAGLPDDPPLTPGTILGTPGYMSPEQARGEPDAVGPSGDVYALGAVLYEVLIGAPPFADQPGDRLRQTQAGRPTPLAALPARHGGLLPAPLTNLCATAMSQDPTARPSAAEFASVLTGWLDGDRRRERAEALLDEADALGPQIARLRAAVAEHRGEARAILDALPAHAPSSDKAPGWALEDRASLTAQQVAHLETDWLQRTHAALQVSPGLSRAHRSLAGHWHARLLEAEARRDAEEAVRCREQLRAHDRGEYSDFLSGIGHLTLQIDPPDAEVVLHRLESVDRRLVPGAAAPVTATMALKQGSYLATLSQPGRASIRLPLHVERGGAQTVPVRLPSADAIRPSEAFIPAGWFISGGDRDAPDALPRRRVWIDDLVVCIHPVTNRAWLDFLDDLVAQGRAGEALRYAPAQPYTERSGLEPLARLGQDGCFRLPDSASWADDVPVVFIDWHGAMAYAAWRSKQDGLSWRLPNELEWEKAARGVDGRRCPWGDHVEPTWACVLGSTASPPGRAPVEAWPDDVSPYGVRGMAGNTRDWCLNAWEIDGPALAEGRLLDVGPGPVAVDDFRSVRGGAWMSRVSYCRSAGRFGNRPAERFISIGLRLCRSLS